MKALYKNLKDQILTNDKSIMYCPICGSEYSANKGDYFMISNPEFKFICCDRTMLLVTKSIKYSIVK